MSNLAVLEIPKHREKKEPKKRGPRGRGNVYRPKYKLADGTVRESKTYWIKYSANGKRHYEDSNSTKKQFAEKLLTDRVGKVDRGEHEAFQIGKNTTLKDIGDMLRAHYKLNGRRSYKKIDLSLRRFEEHFGADFKVDGAFTDEAQESYREYRRKMDPKPGESTIGLELTNLKTALKLAFKADKIKKVPFISLPSTAGRYEDGEFTADQFWTLHGKLKPWMKAPTEFLYRMGWRAQEAFGLKWSEVLWQQSEIRLPGRRTKTGKERPVPLAGKTLELLKAQRQIVPKDCEFVFPGADGERLSYDRACDNLQAACKKLKIGFTKEGEPDGQFTTADGEPRKPGFHDLRRTFARMMFRAGVPIHEIQRIGGWKTLAMVIRYCGDSLTGTRAAIVQADGVFG